MDTVRVALELLALGYRPFPVRQNKVPYVSWKELNDRSPTEQEIVRWWADHPHADIGIVTGVPGGVCVLDIDLLPDPATGHKKSLPNPWPGSRDLPLGWVISTPSGGRHYVFKTPEPPIPNSNGSLGAAIDVRGKGGMAIVHGVDRITLCGSPAEALQTECPAWLLELLKKPHPKSFRHIDPKTVLAGVPLGERDCTLFRYACRLRAQGLKKEEAALLVRQAAENCDPPFPESEWKTKIESAWKYSPGLNRHLGAPRVTGGDGLYNIDWPGLGVQMTFRGVHRRRDGNIVGDLTIIVDGHPRNPFHRSMLCLTAAKNRQDLSNQLVREYALDWLGMIEEVCSRVIERQTAGHPALLLTSSEPPAPIRYILEPWLIEETPTIFFGPGGSGKSYLALILSALVSTGINHPALGWKPRKTGKVLWLDWETSPSDFQRRLYRVAQGLNIPELGMTYRQCFLPIQDDFEHLRDLVMDVQPILIVVDSLSGAASNDLNSPDSALPFYESFRGLLALSSACGLIVAHPPDNNPNKPFGSVFFTNRARDVWAVHGQMQPGTKSCYMLLKHIKTNIAGFKHQVALRLDFEDDAYGAVRLFSSTVSVASPVEEEVDIPF